ncbi:hypothetical protein [Pantoea dispersa]|uniref:Uncharacterized protein n=1 Tax=Pantoea dispersa TaxID=59814 RepID=A0ABY2ZS03_9GAMM|nr:hypothetical protein [Pantoea dispersa]TQC64318.1 hypothetical protein FK492_22505 [Pantoea dispersa]
MAAPESTLIIQRHIPCRVAIHGDRMTMPEPTPIIHGDLMGLSLNQTQIPAAIKQSHQFTRSINHHRDKPYYPSTPLFIPCCIKAPLLIRDTFCL